MKLNPALKETISALTSDTIDQSRKEVLAPLVDYIRTRYRSLEPIRLNFICTHNSRRSQLAQVWATVAAYYYAIDVSNYSGGTETTAFNPRAVEAIRDAGFKVNQQGEDNPIYQVSFSPEAKPVKAFSKVYNDISSPREKFAAIMTCSEADENCPFIPGAEKRIPIRYDDPKAFDGTTQEKAKYEERSLQIANELFYVFSQVKN